MDRESKRFLILVAVAAVMFLHGWAVRDAMLEFETTTKNEETQCQKIHIQSVKR